MILVHVLIVNAMYFDNEVSFGFCFSVGNVNVAGVLGTFPRINI